MGSCLTTSKNKKYWAEKMHDIRGTITPLHGAVQLLQLSKLTIEQKKQIEMIQCSVKKLCQKIDEIRDQTNL